MSFRTVAIVLAAALVAGCAGSSKVMLGQARAPIDPAQVQIYRTPPAGSQEIAQLESKSAVGFGTQGQTDAAVARLKREAAALGANGVVLLGVGWNFLFTGSTTLALTAYRPEEKDRAQAAINFCVFATMAFTSFASGALVTTQGWRWLNLGSLPVLVVIAGALAWLGFTSRTRGAARHG